MVNSSWISFSTSLDSFFQLMLFANYCHLLNFLNNHKIVMSLNFALLVICFTTSTMMKTLARVTRSNFPCETSFLAKPILDAGVICVIMAYFQKNLHSRLATILFYFQNKKKLKVMDQLVFIEVFWEKNFFKNSFLIVLEKIC